MWSTYTKYQFLHNVALIYHFLCTKSHKTVVSLEYFFTNYLFNCLFFRKGLPKVGLRGQGSIWPAKIRLLKKT